MKYLTNMLLQLCLPINSLINAKNKIKQDCVRIAIISAVFACSPIQSANAAAARSADPTASTHQMGAHTLNEPLNEPQIQSQPQTISTDALLPKNRIIGYYGNFHSTRMGVLGEYPPEKMLSMLRAELRKWSAADPNTPVVPAIEYIAVVAQKDAGKDGKYRLRMSHSEIDKAVALAKQVNGIVILDIQTGLSNVEAEMASLEPYLKLPNVMLALDPEFSMPSGKRPGKVIGTMDAREINKAVTYLADLVQKYNLPPKILVVHRFTQRMVTNHHHIKLVPEVQVVMDMDGFGSQTLKKDSYRAYISKEPVQFAGIKLFYKNDAKNTSGLFTPDQLLKLNPVPIFILYQ